MNTGITQNRTWKREALWLLLWCMCTFLLAGIVGWITGGDDHFRGGRAEVPAAEWEQIRQEQWQSFVFTGLLMSPLGAVGWGLAKLFRSVFSGRKPSDEA